MSVLVPAIESWAHDYLGGHGVHVEPLWSIHGRLSRVQRLAIYAAGRREVLYAKTFIPMNGSPEEQARQLRYLTAESGRLRAAAWAFHSTPSLRVPQLVAVLPEHLSIVTTEVEGEPLSSLVVRAALRRTAIVVRRACDALGRAGEWLRRFQEYVPILDQSAFSKDYRAYLDGRLRFLTCRTGEAFTERDRMAALALFDRHAAALSADEWWPQPAHGDFCPANILVTPTSVSVIDFAMSTDRARYLDLTHLHFHLALLGRRVLSGRKILDRLQHALAEGFGSVSPASPLFRALLLQHAICHLVQLASDTAQSRLHRWRFRQRLGWALRVAGVAS
jgi:tRNA A-37 threonylcarbamoyl transferase component Bud32